jgi:hypothetical protein
VTLIQKDDKDNWFYFTKGKRNTNVKISGKSYQEIVKNLNQLQVSEPSVKFKVLDFDYVADRETAFITFSTRQEAEIAVKRFTSSECQYVDRAKINDCALYISFDPKTVPKDEEKENENFFLEELNWLFSFGEKVQCKVEIYRKNGGFLFFVVNTFA